MRRAGQKLEFRLTSPVEFWSAKLATSVFVPTGFTTDFASVGRALEWLVRDTDSDIALAAVLHDYAYRTGGKIAPYTQITRSDADALMLDAMLTHWALSYPDGGFRAWRARAKINLVYAGIRSGGWYTWRQVAKQKAINEKP